MLIICQTLCVKKFMCGLICTLYKKRVRLREGGTLPGSHSWCVEGSCLRQVTPESLSGHRWAVHTPHAPPPASCPATWVHHHLGHLPPRGWSRETDAGLCRESLGLAPTLTAWNSLLQSLQCLPAPQTFQRGTRTPPTAKSPRKLAAWLKRAQRTPKVIKSEWKGIQPAWRPPSP